MGRSHCLCEKQIIWLIAKSAHHYWKYILMLKMVVYAYYLWFGKPATYKHPQYLEISTTIAFGNAPRFAPHLIHPRTIGFEKLQWFDKGLKTQSAS